MYKLSRIGTTLLLVTLSGLALLKAQQTTDSSSSINLSGLSENGVLELTGTNISAFKSFSDSQLNALVSVLDATPTISATNLPRNGMGGTYWSLSQPGMPPFPGNMIGANVWQMSDGSFLLDDLNFDYNSVSAASTQLTAMDSETSGPPGFDDTTTNSYTPNGLTNGIPVNYGTNLWIAQSAVGSGYFTGIGSNTISGVYYVIQSVTNLLEGSNGWQYEGTILGSYATNWTPLSVPQYNRQNLFIRLASQQSSDGSSIPDWWEALYGLTNGVDPIVSGRSKGTTPGRNVVPFG